MQVSCNHLVDSSKRSLNLGDKLYYKEDKSMDKKEVLYTSQSEVRNWESGETFTATPDANYEDNIRFEVSSQYIIDRNDYYVVVDTGNDADL